ncbi:MAG: 16S rRNA (guanine(527)-N(7))-methyltransferase RsmG [Clostridiales bacterium]|nr:16S rRNA (guanine(527)-N(7))-methyltransferase RsmG [Clostridiales bacterium]
MEQKEILRKILSDNGTECGDEQLGQLIGFYEMLVEKNKVMNLTAITEFNEVAIKHFADSLSIGRAIKLDSQKIIDVGTGAGFPGIPLKIVYPGIKLTLLDSLNKRLVFLNEVIDTLGLKDVGTLHARAEEAAGKAVYREQYDVVVSRAVANLSTLVEYCLPFASVGGCFISYKGEKGVEELGEAKKAIKVLGGGNVSVSEFPLIGSDYSRTLIRIEKLSSTPSKYPRAGGKPSSSPIK